MLSMYNVLLFCFVQMNNDDYHNDDDDDNVVYNNVR